ncbi:hypothetical protein DY000_02054916 [Brassica cretica]|uniref:Uncharacterized protein n=1 Tax=Brassica cretica TaxID=69181 RepID=A0ABQ7AEI5_BRACR|nr:hypothetical protein DY000_02054916 [Brassica cretica]
MIWWKEPELSCRSAHLRGRRRRPRLRWRDQGERVSFGSKASDASSTHLFAGKTRRLYPKASPFLSTNLLLRPYLLLL